ncbi:MAG: hypothetical protein H6509_06605 [Bryobacterales bacterium]|nr:hypothetical protein [Bryobacterales bacterium]
MAPSAASLRPYISQLSPATFQPPPCFTVSIVAFAAPPSTHPGDDTLGLERGLITLFRNGRDREPFRVLLKHVENEVQVLAGHLLDLLGWRAVSTRVAPPPPLSAANRHSPKFGSTTSWAKLAYASPNFWATEPGSSVEFGGSSVTVTE